MTGNLEVRPLPPLSDTLDNYRQNIAPLVSAAQLERTSMLCEQLEQTAGPALHEQLLQICADPGQRNWNAGFWDSMYLTQRAPLPIHSSPFFAVEDQPALAGLPTEQLAARLIWATSSVITAIRNNSLAPEMSRGKHQDMVQYQRFFGYAREPGLTRDSTLFDRESRHICVLHKNRFFSLCVFDEHQNALTPAVLADNLAELLRRGDEAGGSPFFPGYLTAGERGAWAASKEQLRQSSPAHARALHTIDSALYVLCIDDNVVTTLAERAEWLLHNRGENRYFDKYQIMISANGKLGSLFEHAPIDALSVGRIWNETIARLPGDEVLKAGAGEQGNQDQPAYWQEISFDLAPELGARTAACRLDFRELCATTQQQVIVLEDFGSTALKTLGVSPDACIQLMFQLSYRNAFGNIDNVYESVSTRQFYEGRTDVLRPVTPASLDFIKRCEDLSTKDALRLLQRATESIVKRRAISARGCAPDHHLSALCQLAMQKRNNCQHYRLPELFTDPAYQLYTRSVISTSNISDPLCLLFGFGPVTPGGLGIAYGTYPEHLAFHISFFDSDRSRIDRFATQLSAALRFLEKLLD